MLNEVIVSGYIQVVHDLGENQLAVIKCNDELFYVFWKTDVYDTSNLEKKYLCIRGYLQHIKFKLEEKVNSLNVLAICVEDMEECEV